MQVRDVMTREVVTVGPESSAKQAGAVMAERGFAALPVVDGSRRVIGMVAEADVLRNRVPADPRLHMRPRTYRGRAIVPLTRYPGGLQVYKQVFHGNPAEPDPEPLSHEGYLWFCVLSGKLRLVLGDQDLVLGAGEIAEFDTHVPHWIGSADGGPVEILNLFGPQGERAHTTARTPTPP